MSSDSDAFENLMSDTIAERKQQDDAAYKAAIDRATRKQEAIDRDSKLVAESEKQYLEKSKADLKRILFYGLDEETSKNLEKLLELSIRLSHGPDQYDKNNAKKIELQAQIDVLRSKITNAGRNLGNRSFTKETYYKSVTGDYLIFSDKQGIYHLFAGELGAFRTTDRSLQVDDKGQPVKIFKQDRIQTSPEIPIIDFETIKVVEKSDVPVKAVPKPRKPIFKNQNVADQENLVNDPQKKRWLGRV